MAFHVEEKAEVVRDGAAGTTLCVGLLLSQIADVGQFVHESLIGLDQKNNPDRERSQGDENVQRERDEYQQRDHPDDGQGNVDDD